MLNREPRLANWDPRLGNRLYCQVGGGDSLIYRHFINFRNEMLYRTYAFLHVSSSLRQGVH
jgi:hypothetical protein